MRLSSAYNRKRKVLRGLGLDDAHRAHQVRIGISIHDWQWPQRRHWPAFRRTCSCLRTLSLLMCFFLVSPTLVRWSPFSASRTCSIQLHHVPFRRHAASTFTRRSLALLHVKCIEEKYAHRKYLVRHITKS